MGLVDFLMWLNGGSIGLSLGFPIGCLGVRFFGRRVTRWGRVF